MTKYIFVTGGVVSSLGKGLAAASIGRILESRGFKITLLKMDPYINVDPGTMNPFQHGEVFVTDDGAETDLDLGHYTRFTNAKLTKKNNVTAGQIYYSVINKERKGEYLGGTVQVIPHITDEIKKRIRALAKGAEIVIVEIGGTVGDIEGLPFLEAVRQFRFDLKSEHVLYVHVTLVPFIKASGEIKTKPTQHSVKALSQIGIQPDILLCRTETFLPKEVKKKIALFCNVEEEAVVTAKDVECIYDVPLVFEDDGLGHAIVAHLNLPKKRANLTEWREITDVMRSAKHGATVAIVGKYVLMKDSYKSLLEAFSHGGYANGIRVKLKMVDAEDIERDGAEEWLADADGLMVPGGFGMRGIEGMIKAVEYARVQKMPFFGICLGMQCAVIEYSRNVCGLDRANSTEFDENTPHPVIWIMPSQRKVRRKGASMRLGAMPCSFAENSLVQAIYGQKIISERHRHRFELNPKYAEELERHGLRLSGVYEKKNLIEVVELPGHPWFLASQFHPEWRSKPDAPHPLFSSFVAAMVKRRKG
ncbi:MAG: CTP synthase [Candidatus Coatesbacteria bacterium]|nr:CTP synthase [Candidatus Coatesbacteria bacterium]